MMKVVWEKDEITAQRVQELLPGSKVIGVSVGRITVGHTTTKAQNGVTDITQPITVNGVEIEFEDEPTEGELEKIDSVLPYRRQGKETVMERMERRIEALERRGAP